MVLFPQSGGGTGHTIEDEGVPLTNRSAISFEGPGVVVSDDGSKTIVTITGSGVGEANTTSNSGAGEGLALAKVGDDLPFKSLTASDATATLTASATEIDIKVTNPFSASEKTKLSNIETAATADQTGAEIKTAYQAEANAYTDTKNTKLSGIEALAEVNPLLITQALAEAGVETAEKMWSALRVKQAIDALGGSGGDESFESKQAVATGSNISFTGFAARQRYKLIIRIRGISSAGNKIGIQFNNDTGNNYGYRHVQNGIAKSGAATDKIYLHVDASNEEVAFITVHILEDVNGDFRLNWKGGAHPQGNQTHAGTRRDGQGVWNGGAQITEIDVNNYDTSDVLANAVNLEAVLYSYTDRF